VREGVWAGVREEGGTVHAQCVPVLHAQCVRVLHAQCVRVLASEGRRPSEARHMQIRLD
jgi:hypothetical protein